ncbi:MAG TPA: thioesterase family protein [Rhizomicrobium sp.]|nr:thioesterase family protein [Rhizomicrobium sp.]
MIELARSSVQTWECDQMGHMNVQFYVEKSSDAIAALLLTCGLGTRHLAQSGRAVEPFDTHIRFLRELRPGTPYFLRGGFIGWDMMALTAYCELVQTASGEVSASFVTKLRSLDVHSRKPHAFDDGVLAMAAHNKVELPVHGAARGLTLDAPRETAPSMADADQMNLLRTFQGVVKPQECDATGFMQPRFFMARVSDAIPNLLVQTSGRDRGADTKVGGAALEYRFIYRKFPRAGDVLAVRSGLRSLGTKTYVWAHWLIDVESGEAVATSEAVAVAMDLTTRRAIALPDDLRARLEPLVISDLTI